MKNNIYNITIKELSENIKNFLMDLGIDPKDLSKKHEYLIFSECISIVSYWSLNKAKIYLKKDKNKENLWLSYIIEDNLTFFPLKSPNKYVAVIGTCLLYQQFKFINKDIIDQQ